jgi:uncharacterized protein (UPF0548 family)
LAPEAECLTYPASAIGTSLSRTRGERRAVIGAGAECFARASAANLRWAVKTRSGFRVARIADGSAGPEGPVTVGETALIRFGPIRERVRVVRVVDEPRRRGFAYGTLPQHPLIGEEAFLVEWRDDDRVDLVIRSFSRPNGWLWTLLWPVVALARQVVLRRYLRALVD